MTDIEVVHVNSGIIKIKHVNMTVFMLKPVHAFVSRQTSYVLSIYHSTLSKLYTVVVSASNCSLQSSFFYFYYCLFIQEQHTIKSNCTSACLQLICICCSWELTANLKLGTVFAVHILNSKNKSRIVSFLVF